MTHKDFWNTKKSSNFKGDSSIIHLTYLVLLCLIDNKQVKSAHINYKNNWCVYLLFFIIIRDEI